MDEAEARRQKLQALKERAKRARGECCRSCVSHPSFCFSFNFFLSARGERGGSRERDTVAQRSDARARACWRPVMAEGGGDAEDAPKLKFRNYQPKADELKDGVMPQIKVSADKELEKMGAVASPPPPHPPVLCQLFRAVHAGNCFSPWLPPSLNAAHPACAPRCKPRQRYSWTWHPKRQTGT
jgi:hypothetical protein